MRKEWETPAPGKEMRKKEKKKKKRKKKKKEEKKKKKSSSSSSKVSSKMKRCKKTHKQSIHGDFWKSPSD